MLTPTHKPVIFLAFAQDRVEDGAYLRNLPNEQDGIRKALQKARQAGLCDVIERSNTTVENILDVFQEYRDRIAIFHYGGHADSYELLLESLSGERATAHSEGLVSFLAKQQGLQLVFLNGCCSQQQALDLIEAGVPAVVGTSQKIDDGVATNLSQRFYKGLAAGLAIDRAWAEAVDQVKVEKGTSNTRALHWKGKVEASDRFPWEIYYRPGAEVVRDWNLPEAAENPLFGLPAIPKTYDLPETPFLFLKRYERQHAEIFFGRSYYIRDLYNRVSDPNSPPVILLYGQSGVGKSSLFDAGLNPRLENDYKVAYIRRIQEKGLAGTLEHALAEELAALPEPLQAFPEQPDEPAIEPPESQALLSHLEAAAENAGDDLKHEIEALIRRLQSSPKPAINNKRRARQEPPEGDTTNQQPAISNQLPAPLLEQWLSIETQSGKPLIVILDQVEELFTRPNQGLPDELADLLLALRTIFGSPTQRPRGKLILGYRKEYHPEIEEGCKTFLLPRATVFLEPLRRKDILDIFRGVSQTPGLKQRYNLSVEEALPVILADDLLEDKESPVAPVLQIVLTKLWNAANKDNAVAPRFKVSQYQQLKKDGIAMGEFFEQQMQQLRRWNPAVVDSGLALDVLHFHITALGTAGTRSLDELRQTYQHRQDLIDSLVGKCKELYLLTEAQHSAAHTSLTHDTLAPVVNNEYNNSDKPGQRAARILNSKMSDFSENGSQVWLDEADLALVENGSVGMRKLDAREEQVLALSREKRRQRQRLRRQLKGGAAVISLIVLGLSAFGWLQWQRAETQLRVAQAQNLAAQAQIAYVYSPNAEELGTTAPERGVLLALESLNAYPTVEGDLALRAGLRKLTALPLDSPIDEDTNRWNEPEAAVGRFPALEIAIEEDAYLRDVGPHGSWILLETENGMRVFDSVAKTYRDASPAEMRRMMPASGDTSTEKFGQQVLAWSSDGQWFVVESDEGLGEWVFASAAIHRASDDKKLALLPHEWHIKFAAFSPDAQWLVTVTGKASMDASDPSATALVGSTVRVWEVSSGRKITEVSMANEGGIGETALSPDGDWLATESYTSTGRIVILWPLWPELLRAEACKRLTRNLSKSEWETFVKSQPQRETCSGLPVVSE